MFNATTVAYLKKFYTKSQIEAFWKQVGDVLMSRSTEKVTITSDSLEGASSSGIVLNTPVEMQSFMASCEEAIRLIDAEDDSPQNPSELGTSAIFNLRAVQV